MSTVVRWLAGIAVVLVVIQAALIGQALFLGDSGMQALHGWIGNAAFVAVVVMAIIALLDARRGEAPATVAGVGVLVALLMAAQLGLGYVGRQGGWPAALHIPNGVLIVALLTAVLTVALLQESSARREPR
jgi:hypothetical protein